MKLDNILDVVKKAAADSKPEKMQAQTKAAEKASKAYKAVSKSLNVPSMEVEQMDSGKKKTIEEAFAGLQDTDTAAVKNYISVMSNMMTTEDFAKLQEEGYSLNDTEVKKIVTVVEKIKIKLAAACDDYKMTGNVDMDKVREVMGNVSMAMKVSRNLEKNNLPVTEENVTDALNAMEEASQLSPISEASMKYMIKNEMEPTISNIYKAEHSSTTINNQGGQGYYTDSTPGYYAKKSSDINWDAIEGQMKGIIELADMEVDSYSMENAKWLVQNDLSLTPENLKQMDKIRNVVLPQTPEEFLSKIVDGMADGRRAGDALLNENSNCVSRAVQAMEVVEQATDEDLKEVLESGKEVTIRNLEEVQKQESNSRSEGEPAREQRVLPITKESYSFITARRQLEEIRLQMTLEASVRMLRQGIEIETQSLERLVEELKVMEQQYYRQLFSGSGLPVTDDNISMYRETTEKVQDLKSMPMYALGKIASTSAETTIDTLHAAGKEVRASMEAANQKYETMMTQPRSDLGDSLSKAFQNVTSMLKDMGLEATEANIRAVKILGYNQMEISEKTIMEVKEADSAVNRVMRDLTPSAAMELIRRGVNPLDMDMNELNSEISEIKKETGSADAQKYSEFLWKLERNEEISKEQRNAYIGIYRLFNQIEKSEGSVIGALVHQNTPITMRNLISSVKSSRQKGMDVAVDNSFKSPEAVPDKVNTMSVEIESAFRDNPQKSSKFQYSQNLVNEAMHEMDPHKLTAVQNPDVTLEKFVEDLRNAPANEEINQAYQEEQLKQIKQAKTIENQVIQNLTKYDQPVTLDNLMASEQLLNERGLMFKRLMHEAKKQPGGKDRTKEIAAAMDRITDRLISDEAAEEAYQEMEKKAEEIVEASMEDENISYVNLRDLKLLHQGIQLAANLSKDENYEIPIMINEELTSINLRVIRNSDVQGRVKATMDSEVYGKVAAEFTIKGKQVSGVIITDSKEGADLLKESDKIFKLRMAEGERTVRRIDYVCSPSIDINRFNDGSEKSLESSANTKDLYEVAKAFVVTVRESEQQMQPHA